MKQPLYRRLLASRYDLLPQAVQKLHDCRAPSLWRGRCTVMRGTSYIARAVASLMSLPPSTPFGEVCEIHVTFTPNADGGEEWVRTFAVGPKPRPFFYCRQWESDGELNERILFTRFVFDLEANSAGLGLILKRCYSFGLPIPRTMHPLISTSEYERDGRYTFDVEASLPLGGELLVHYSGWLLECSEMGSVPA